MTKRILVADDELFMRRLFEHHLGKAGHRVSIAANGREALEKAASEKPHLIVMDVMMREMDGMTALKELKDGEATRAIPVVLVTASAQVTRQQAEEMGAAAFFTKPFSPSQLLREINRLLDAQEFSIGQQGPH